MTPEAIPLTDAQRAELDRRLDELDVGEVEGIRWDDVLRRIKNRSS
jgi:putative addiction module component (TIGR02574 family)